MTILPKRLQKALMTALKQRDDGSNKQQSDLTSETASRQRDDGSSKQRSDLTSEAFLRMFIETVGHYGDYVNTQQNEEQVT